MLDKSPLFKYSRKAIMVGLLGSLLDFAESEDMVRPHMQTDACNADRVTE